MKVRTFAFGFIIPVTLLMTFTTPAANAEGDPWEIVSGIGFSSDKIGFVMWAGDFLQDKRGPFYYELNPSNGEMSAIDSQKFKSIYPKAKDTITDYKWGEHPNILHTSNGSSLKIEDSECETDEIAIRCKKHHVTYENQRFLLDTEKQCRFGCSVLFAEVIDNQLWLGLGTQGELEWYGSGLQVYDLKTHRLLFAYDERIIGGFMTYGVGKNPSTGDYWIASNVGIRAFDSNFKLIKGYLFFEWFNKETGLAEYQTRPFSIEQLEPPRSILPMLARMLKVKDFKSFANAANLIPDAEREQLIYAFYGRTPFPDQAASLLPFVIQGIQNNPNDWYTVEALCCFVRHNEAANLLKKIAANQSKENSQAASSAAYCLSRHHPEKKQVNKNQAP